MGPMCMQLQGMTWIAQLLYKPLIPIKYNKLYAIYGAIDKYSKLGPCLWVRAA